MNNITSTTIIGWESRNWQRKDKAITWCKNYGLKPIMKNLYIGPLYEKEHKAISSLLNNLFTKKSEKFFIGNICQSCFKELDQVSKEKAGKLPAFEIVQFQR